MEWTAVDFRGITHLERPLIDKLKKYLEEKETQLATSLTQVIHSEGEVLEHPLPKPESPLPIKLSEAIEVIGKKIRVLVQNPQLALNVEIWQKNNLLINKLLWDYVEVLESCVVELFQQVNQVGIEQWRSAFAQIIEEIKELLAKRIDDVTWNIRRLEQLLDEYRQACDGGAARKWKLLKQLFFIWKPAIDKSILANLDKSQKYLLFQYKKFLSRFNDYYTLQASIEASFQKVTHYAVLETLEDGTQAKYRKLYKLVRLWEANRKSRSLPQREFVQAIRGAVSVGKGTAIFYEYYGALRYELFELSRRLKDNSAEFVVEKGGTTSFLAMITERQGETQSLASTIAKYRDFLLRTDPNPYTRSRWGFTEWIVGPEPLQTQELLSLAYDVEQLGVHFDTIRLSVQEGPSYEEGVKIGQINLEVQRLLHEMGQPLTSRQRMKANAEHVLNQLVKLNELGSFSWEVVDFIEQTLTKLLRVDWKYNVLFEINQFSQFFMLHQGILGAIDDRNYLNRYNKFKRILQQIEDWVHAKSTLKHLHEIELDINDIKGYLQDFFGQIQRICGGEFPAHSEKQKMLKNYGRQLLQYRYLFGKFFHLLRLNDPNEKWIRNQFLFVDQYFESIENKLTIKSS